MPNIREFDNKVDGLTPSDRGAQSAILVARHTEAQYAQAGHAIGTGIAEAGDAYTTARFNQEVSQGFATKDQMWANFTTRWNALNATADPNDPAVGDSFRQNEIHPVVEKWVESFGTEPGRKWAEAQAEQLETHFRDKIMADRANASGVAQVTNLHDSVVSLSNGVREDPETLPVAMGSLDAHIEAIALAHGGTLGEEWLGKLRGETRTELRTMLAQSAVEGTARKDPDKAMADLAAGKYNAYLDGTHQDALFGKALEQKHANDQDAYHQHVMNREQEKDAANAEMTALYAQGIGKGPNGSWAPPPGYQSSLLDIIRRHPTGVNMSEAHAAQNMVSTYVEDQASGKLVVSDPGTYGDFTNRMTIPPGQPGALTKAEIYQAAADHKLSMHDASVLTDTIDKVQSDPNEKALQQTMKAFFDGQKGFVQGTMAVPSATAQRRFYEFKVAIGNAVAFEKEHGKTAPEIQRDLFDPQSKNYVGRANAPWMQYYHTGLHPERGGVILSLIPGHPDNVASPGAPVTGANATAILDGLAKQ